MKNGADMEYTRSKVLITLIACFMVAPCASAQREATTKDRFFREAPSAWKQYGVQAARLQGTVHETVTRKNGERVIDGKLELKQSKSCALVAHHSGKTNRPDKTTWELSAINSKYRFTLRRRDENSDWTLNEVVIGPGFQAPRKNAPSTHDWVKGIVNLPITLNFNTQDDWSAILASPHFVVAAVNIESNRRGDLVRVDFDLGWQPTSSNPIRVVKKGRVWFDPQHFWVMRKCEYKMQRGPGGKIYDHVADFEYEFLSDAFPVLTKMTVTNVNSVGVLSSTETMIFSLQLGDLSENEFTLTAFGIPEPFGVDWPRPIRWYVWIPITAATVIAIGIGLLKVRKRNRADTV